VRCYENHVPLCRHHHRCKQAQGWSLEQPEPGVLKWRTPSGRTYATSPPGTRCSHRPCAVGTITAVSRPVSDIVVLGDAPVAILRYQARISFDDGPGFTCWHTDCYRLQDERWQVVWSQATRIIVPEQPR
jgi:hypothetical protein